MGIDKTKNEVVTYRPCRRPSRNPAEVIRAAELSIKEIDDWNKSSSIVGVVRKFRCKFCNRMMPEGINPKNHQDEIVEVLE